MQKGRVQPYDVLAGLYFWITCVIVVTLAGPFLAAIVFGAIYFLFSGAWFILIASAFILMVRFPFIWLITIQVGWKGAVVAGMCFGLVATLVRSQKYMRILSAIVFSGAAVVIGRDIMPRYFHSDPTVIAIALSISGCLTGLLFASRIGAFRPVFYRMLATTPPADVKEDKRSAVD